MKINVLFPIHKYKAAAIYKGLSLGDKKTCQVFAPYIQDILWMVFTSCKADLEPTKIVSCLCSTRRALCRDITNSTRDNIIG